MLNPYYLYMAEAEGYLDTREGKLQAVIKDIKNYNSPVMPEEEFYNVLKRHQIDPASLSQRELNRIQSAIS